MAVEPAIPDSPYETLAEIEALVAGFTSRTLPCKQWTHRAHLTVGLWHVREYGPVEALQRLRSGIRSYNDTCGTVNSATSGYHETITRFYVWLLARYLDAVEDRSDWPAVTNELFATCGAREVPLAYYTRERLMSPEARAAWVEPDLRPLDGPLVARPVERI